MELEKLRRLTVVFVVLILAWLALGLVFARAAVAGDRSGPTGQILTVDGVDFENTGETNGTVHWYTNTPNPQAANYGSQVWGGQGSEHLPCEGLVHWVSNKSKLVISHCEPPQPTTTTTVPETTTTTEVPPSSTTTTTVPNPTTTTTTTPEPTTTTSTPPSSTTSTTEVPVTTTTEGTLPPPSSTPPTLPYTGMGSGVATVAVALMATGLMGLALSRRGGEA